MATPDTAPDPAALVAHPTPDERVARGKAARAAVPRRSHAEWELPADRTDPITILEQQSEGRVADLVPIRYGRMLVSPFAFYRGAAAVMASDLSTTPTSGIRVQACGDAHLSNFGLFASPERSLLFDINDFDETVPGPWEWDVKRLAASIVIAGRDNGFSSREQRAAVLEGVGAYREAMTGFAGTGNMDVWYARAAVKEGMPRLQEALKRKELKKKDVKQAEQIVAKAMTRDSMQAFEKLTTVVDGHRQIVHDPPLVVRLETMLPPSLVASVTEALRSMLRSYRRTLVSDRRHLLSDFRFVDIAHKVVGVGSVGTRAWILLFLGRDDEDPLFLQAKEAQASVLAPYVGRSRYRNHGQRVVEGQRMMQAASDIFLGWDRVEGLDGTRDYYVRQLRDWKGSWAPEAMDPRVMGLVAQMCGWTLARAHARSGDRIAIASYLGASDTFDTAIESFAQAYADQNERDHAALRTAADEGRIAAREGV